MVYNYSMGCTIAQFLLAIQATDETELQQFFSQHKNSNRSKRKRPFIQLKVHASIFDIISNNSRQRNSLKGLFSLEIDVIRVSHERLHFQVQRTKTSHN